MRRSEATRRSSTSAAAQPARLMPGVVPSPGSGAPARIIKVSSPGVEALLLQRMMSAADPRKFPHKDLGIQPSRGPMPVRAVSLFWLAPRSRVLSQPRKGLANIVERLIDPRRNASARLRD